MDYEIVMATERDRSDILSLYRAQIGREGCPWNEHYPSDETIDYDFSREALFIVKRDDKTIACASIEYDEEVNKLPCWNKELEPESEFARICVDPCIQNRGVGRILLEFIAQEIKRRGYNGIHIIVNKKNTKALKLYDSFGFANVGECFMYDQDFWCYEKDLR